MHKIAQAKPGDTIAFESITLKQAHNELAFGELLKLINFFYLKIVFNFVFYKCIIITLYVKNNNKNTGGRETMEMNTRDIVMKKLLDAQENVRDYETYSKQVEDKKVASMFKDFAEECGSQASKLQVIMDKIDKY